ncbi:DUF421 domain-containing protein [Paenibacillus wenxiniae]|uniref:DUF421 domain-containing protein n=1 Tax=Paenibacillus wenxiniae TaxID=1636843 RepID=A0ABW4RPE9_9BACL
MFFNTWQDIARIVIIGILSYVALILLLRTAGKRTLSQMNAFDFAVSVAVGSTLSTVILNRDIAFAEGLTAFIVLIGLQMLMGWLAVRSDKFERALKADAQLLYYKGNYLRQAMRRSRISREDMYQTVRKQGESNMTNIQAVIMESDGSLSLIMNSGNEQGEKPAEETEVMKKVNGMQTHKQSNSEL